MQNLNYEQALEFIHSRPRIKKADAHKGIKLLLEYLGNPQDYLKIIHIAGTNGKGSCASMTANVLKRAGYKTGLNISPFVIDFTERFSINGEYIDKEKLAKITSRIKYYQEKILKENEIQLVEFEVVTAIAFTYFKEEGCDIVCLEVGIGGRLDTTNVIKSSLLSVIMNISYDHTEMLGDTIDKIAYEKAGIIKENTPVVIYPKLEELALLEIKKTAKEKNAEIVIPSLQDFFYKNTGVLKSSIIYKEYNINLAFTGIHQAYNSLVVIEVANKLRELGFNITDDNIINGIENTKFPARIEVISDNPIIILDGAHNIDGATALSKVLKENNLTDFVAVWSSLSDKHPEDMIKLLSPYISTIYITELFGPRKMTKEELSSIAKNYINEVHTENSVEDAVKKAVLYKGKNILIFGSLYLASDARKILL